VRLRVCVCSLATAEAAALVISEGVGPVSPIHSPVNSNDPSNTTLICSFVKEMSCCFSGFDVPAILLLNLMFLFLQAEAQ
jgi:hypothetical protein